MVVAGALRLLPGAFWHLFLATQGGCFADRMQPCDIVGRQVDLEPGMYPTPLRRVGVTLVSCGIDPRLVIRAVRGIPRFLLTLKKYRRGGPQHGFPLVWRCLCPVLVDFFGEAVNLDRHYFYQDLWAARTLFIRKPSHHVDVGSRIDGFVAHVLTFMPVTVVDVRPLTAQVPGLSFIQDDASNLSAFRENTVESLSSLHALEHFGLGRFGDEVDPSAWFQAIQTFARVLRPCGHLYLSVPVGRERVEFNAHRVFSPARFSMRYH